MAKICQYARKIDEDLYLCSKNRSYCYLDEPNETKCKELYGSDDEYNGVILDDEDSIEDSI